MKREKRFPVTNRWIEQWVALRSQQPPVTLEKIAQDYGVSRGIVHRYTVNKVKPPEGGWLKERFQKRFCRDEARRLEEQGWSRAEIARHFKVSGASVTNALGPKQRRAA